MVFQRRCRNRAAHPLANTSPQTVNSSGSPEASSAEFVKYFDYRDKYFFRGGGDHCNPDIHRSEKNGSYQGTEMRALASE